MPSFRSTIALLAEPSGGRKPVLRDGTDCLVLVDIDDWWALLSERALRVYEVGAALDEHRPVQFAHWEAGHRKVWNVQIAPAIPLGAVRQRFGKEAARRGVPGVKSIMVRCTRNS